MTDDECARGKGKFLQDRWIVGDCRWLKPVLVGKFEFLGWTGDGRPRHTKFVGLRNDTAARDMSVKPKALAATDSALSFATNPTCTSVTAAIDPRCPIRDNAAYSSPIH
jgi:hypothetical protein